MVDPDTGVSSALTSPAALQAFRQRRAHESGLPCGLRQLQKLEAVELRSRRSRWRTCSPTRKPVLPI